MYILLCALLTLALAKKRGKLKYGNELEKFKFTLEMLLPHTMKKILVKRRREKANETYLNILVPAVLSVPYERCSVCTSKHLSYCSRH